MKTVCTRISLLLALVATGCSVAAQPDGPGQADSGIDGAAGFDSSVGPDSAVADGADADADADGEGDADGDAEVVDHRPRPETDDGYPTDFPELTDVGGMGEGQVIQGFGGDTRLDRAGHRAALEGRPVILLHGNGSWATGGASATGETARVFGMETLRDNLVDVGYEHAAIWAPSYLGQSVVMADVDLPTRSNMEDVRSFVDAVLEYLDADRVDLVGHSLGCSLIHGYLRGLQADGSFSAEDQRFDQAGTVVCLGGSIYGTSASPLDAWVYGDEFYSGSSWLTELRSVGGVEDPTAHGLASEEEQIAPESGTLPGSRPFRRVTDLDGAGRRIYYVALWAPGDIIEWGCAVKGCANTGGLQGADLNQAVETSSVAENTLGPELARHANLVQERHVFDIFLPYLGMD